VFAIVPVNYLNVENQEFNQSEGNLVNSNETNFGLEFLDFLILDLYRACRSIKEKERQNENIISIWDFH
jgi:hypothetical protein